MRIGVIGAGKVGSGLAQRWIRQGHDVALSFSRDRSRLDERAAEIGAVAASPAEAVSFGDVVVLACPWSTVEEALASAGPLEGAVLIDCTNVLDAGPGPSGAEVVAGLANGAQVVKAFNTVFEALYGELDQRSELPDMAYCGDDGDAKLLAAQLIEDAGFRPIDAGGLDVAADLEGLARLVIGIAYRQGRGPFFYRFELAPGAAR